jgi:hypothetical protein
MVADQPMCRAKIEAAVRDGRDFRKKRRGRHLSHDATRRDVVEAPARAQAVLQPAEQELAQVDRLGGGILAVGFDRCRMRGGERGPHKAGVGRGRRSVHGLGR